MKSRYLGLAALVACLAGSSLNGAHAQAHFDERIAAIKKEIAALPADTTGTIVMLGDSITQGFFNGSMPKTIDGITVVNEGISGDQIDRPTSNTGVVTRLDLVKQAKPAVVFVLIGINDMWGGKETPEATITQYEDMAKKLKATVPDAKIVYQSIFPTSKKNAYLNEGVKKVNERIKQLASESGDMYLDMHPILADEKGELKAEFTGDGVHLTKAGYDAWLKKLNEVVPTLIK